MEGVTSAMNILGSPFMQSAYSGSIFGGRGTAPVSSGASTGTGSQGLDYLIG
jgi:hypothetical protein